MSRMPDNKLNIVLRYFFIISVHWCLFYEKNKEIFFSRAHLWNSQINIDKLGKTKVLFIRTHNVIWASLIHSKKCLRALKSFEIVSFWDFKRFNGFKQAQTLSNQDDAIMFFWQKYLI